ncbi:hypothetical protein Slin14017_G111570 [Septoria linicola]|nr:hypothetical protein Slin14017_G111570 [Septoria linicola]
MRSLSIFALAASVLATPLENNQRHQKGSFCSGVDKVIDQAREQSHATQFCSSYLRIPACTSTVTSTSTSTSISETTTTYSTTTIVAPVSTITVTTAVDSTVSNTVNTVATVTSGTTTITVTSALTACTAPPVKRAMKRPTQPTCLAKYTPGKALSSACSCLSIPKSTARSTVTKVSTKVDTSTVSVFAFTTTTPLTTTILTNTNAFTTVVTSTSTTTVPASTMTVTRQDPFYLTAKGAGLDGTYARILPGDGFDYTQFSATSQAQAARWLIDTDGSLFSQDRNTIVQSTCGSIPYVAFNSNPACAASTSCTIVSEGGQCRLACRRFNTVLGGLVDGSSNFSGPNPDSDDTSSDGSWALGNNFFSYPEFTPIAVTA